MSTPTMMVPYPGKDLHLGMNEGDIFKDSFNFCQSQLRINIECTFGIFIQCWGIFWVKSKLSIEHFMKIVHCYCRLHHYRMKRKHAAPVGHDTYALPDGARIDSDGRLVNDCWRVDNENCRAFLPSEVQSSCGSALRESILKKIERCGYTHARSHNV